MTETAAHPALPSLPFRVAGLSARKPTRFAFRPDAEGRSAIAAALGLLDLPFFVFGGEIRPAGRSDFELVADMKAKVVQPCSISLAPVPAEIAEPVHRLYQAEFHQPEAEEAEMMDDEAEPLPEVLDIAAIAVEALALALPLYPRAPGVELGEVNYAEAGVAPITDADLRPFAGLASLADRLKKPDPAAD